MSTPLDPIVSEFATQEEADAYDRWFREKIRKSQIDPRPNIPHEEVMTRARELLAEKRRARNEH